MSHKGLDLSNINLPAEDANKPADLNWTPAGDEGADNEEVITTDPGESKELIPPLGGDEDETREPIVPPTDKATSETPDSKVEPEKKETTPEEKKEETPEVKTETTPDPEKKEDPEKVDFHNHPDWKKREKELEETKLEKAKLEGKLEVMEKKGIITEEKKEEAKSAAQIAEDAVLKKREGGWEPKDALELNKVFSEEFEKALDAKEAAKVEATQKEQDAVEERRKEIQKEVESVYTEFGITDRKDQDKVADLAMKWANEGTANWSIGTLKLAADHLQAKGQIGKVSTPTPEPKPIETPEVKTDKKADVNRKIQQPTNAGGGGGAPEKKSIGELRRKSLDQIVFDSQEALG